MRKKVLLVRGLPATGKTTLANRLGEQLNCTVHEYEESENQDALLQKAIETMQFNGEEHTVLIANFIQSSYIRPVVEAFSRRYGSVDFQFYIANGGNGQSATVPMSTVHRMRMNFQANEDVIKDLSKRFPQHRYFDCFQPRIPRQTTRR